MEQVREAELSSLEKIIGNNLSFVALKQLHLLQRATVHLVLC